MEERERRRPQDDLKQAKTPEPYASDPPRIGGDFAFYPFSMSTAVTQHKLEPPDRNEKPIAIYHEHPDWFKPLFEELDRRELPYVRLDAAAHTWDPSEEESPYSVVVNRASPSAYLRGHAQSTFHTLHWLKHLERIGVPVVNGSTVYTSELSKALQLDILEELGLPYPRARVINNGFQAPAAANGLRFPVLVKANIGGSGAGILRFDTPEQLADAARDGVLDLGVDHTALVQELAPLRDGHITRVEVLGGKFLYAIKVYPADGSFNLCPADVCQTTDGRELERTFCAADAKKNGMRVEGYTPPPEIIEAVEAIAERVQLDIGGIEYLIDDRDGKPCFYDINALSNFVADAQNVIGFDPFVRFADYIESRAGIVSSELAGAR
jgi:glutathione synthase/RimK-type ligase-like ATP-grasp enzyme